MNLSQCLSFFSPSFFLPVFISSKIIPFNSSPSTSSWAEKMVLLLFMFPHYSCHGWAMNKEKILRNEFWEMKDEKNVFFKKILGINEIKEQIYIRLLCFLTFSRNRWWQRVLSKHFFRLSAKTNSENRIFPTNWFSPWRFYF